MLSSYLTSSLIRLHRDGIDTNYIIIPIAPSWSSDPDDDDCRHWWIQTIHDLQLRYLYLESVIGIDGSYKSIGSSFAIVLDSRYAGRSFQSAQLTIITMLNGMGYHGLIYHDAGACSWQFIDVTSKSIQLHDVENESQEVAARIIRMHKDDHPSPLLGLKYPGPWSLLFCNRVTQTQGILDDRREETIENWLEDVQGLQTNNHDNL